MRLALFLHARVCGCHANNLRREFVMSFWTAIVILGVAGVAGEVVKALFRRQTAQKAALVWNDDWDQRPGSDRE